MSKPLFVSILGWSGSGKTTLIVRSLEECRRRGLRAAAAKRARHDADVAPSGKDSTRFIEAGAIASLYVGDRSSARFEATPSVQDRAYYERLLPDADLIFLEGALVEGAVRVLVAGGASSAKELKRPARECEVLVAKDPSLVEGSADIVRIDPDEIGEFLDYLEVRHGP